jgi:hypothetical protein
MSSKIAPLLQECKFSINAAVTAINVRQRLFIICHPEPVHLLILTHILPIHPPPHPDFTAK